MTRSGGQRRAFGAAAMLSALLAASPARAQSGDEKAAQEAFDEGMRLLNAGKTAEACAKLDDSQRLDPAIGTEFRLAECYEKAGKTATAWSLFNDVATLAHAAKNTDREAYARRRAAALELRLSRLLLVVPPAVAAIPDLAVQRDGAPVDPAAWGTPLAVDPGDHEISASAPGRRPWQEKRSVAWGKRVEVKIPLLESAGPGGAASSPPEVNQRHLILPLALGGAALLGVGAGAGLAAAGARKQGDADDLRASITGGTTGGTSACVSPAAARAAPCAQLADTSSAAAQLKSGAFWAFAGATVAAGVMVFTLVRPPGRSRSSGVVVAPAPGGAVLAGAF